MMSHEGDDLIVIGFDGGDYGLLRQFRLAVAAVLMKHVPRGEFRATAFALRVTWTWHMGSEEEGPNVVGCFDRGTRRWNPLRFCFRVLHDKPLD